MTFLALAAAACAASAQEPPSRAPWGASSDMVAPLDLPAVSTGSGKTGWGQALASPSAAAAPWMTSVSAAAVASSSASAAGPLLRDWSWRRMSGDLDLVVRLRRGLEAELADAAMRPEVFPPRGRRRGELFPEWRDAAVAVWRRVLDRLLALDTLVARYNVFDGVGDPERRAACFLAAYAAFAAETRFGREWEVLAAEPALQRHLEAAQPDLGAAAGTFTSLKAALRSAARTQALSHAKAYAAGPSPRRGEDFQFAGAAGLLRAGGAAAFALDGLRRDTRGVRAWRAARGAKGAELLPAPEFAPWVALETAAGAWTGEEIQPPAAAKESEPVLFELPASAPAWTPGMYLPGVTEGAEPAKAPLGPPPWEKYLWRVVSTGPAPAALVNLDQLAELEALLEPGDIVLLRRESRIDEAGSGGWWHSAALYFGAQKERVRLGGDAFEASLNQAAPGAYWRNLSPEAPWPRRVAVAEPGGVALRSLERACSADSLAVLRPRAGREAAAEAVRRAFAAERRRLDPVGLIQEAYSGLRLEPRGPAEAGPPTPNDIARTFDAEFGTSARQLELVRFLDARAGEHRAVAADVVEFRRSWRRPRWRSEKNEKKAEAVAAAASPGIAP